MSSQSGHYPARPSRLPTIPSSDDRYSPSSPSPGSSWAPALPMAPSISVPITGTRPMGENAVAGPSSEGALSRRLSRAESPVPPHSPSSAPPNPSVIASTHPSEYIHTQHPRRGSLTPLGLHVISPVPPPLFSPSFPSSPVRSYGFSPSASVSQGLNTLPRRGSAASTSSTLTQSRPGVSPAYPPGFNRERRRSSLTPSLPTLAPPSPSRALASGRIIRPSTSDGPIAPTVHERTRTAEGAPRHPRSQVPPVSMDNGRRGSLPHLYHGSTQRTWNPSLPPQRGSIGEDLPGEGFKFGAGIGETSTAAAALKAVDLSPSSRRSSFMSPGKKREDMDAFEQAEAEEAERQRRAFLAATYGGDGKRARERLSIGGPSMTPSGSPGTPGSNNLRRQSLMLWERMNMSALTGTAVDSSTSPPAVTLPDPIGSADNLGQRRGSLPVAIPGGGIARSPPRRSARTVNQQSGEDEEEEEDATPPENDTLHAPLRPLPPLLPLSDPGPRLLPSTLALHRASHLLNSRNLVPEPLPHPLPPSLHPPAPIDLAEFDIDFILAGSLTQLGGESSMMNAPVYALRRKDQSSVPATPTLQLGEEEDSFAKFVGEFDDEYGDRRGEWTFRSCSPAPPSNPRDPFIRETPKSEWESPGAGRYELFSDGRVRSIQTGRVWRLRKVMSREYELEDVSNKTRSGGCYVLACKLVHSESGGVRLSASMRNTQSPIEDIAPILRISISESSGTSRTVRKSSKDSNATVGQSMPSGYMTPKKGKLPHREAVETLHERGRASISFGPARSFDKAEVQKKKEKMLVTEPEDRKKDRTISGIFKRGLLASLKGTVAAHDEKKALREEKERERLQSQSWSPSGTSRARRYDPSEKLPPVPPVPRVLAPPIAARSSSTYNEVEKVPWPSQPLQQERKAGCEDSAWRGGKAWEVVPDEAIAVVIPLESDELRTPHERPAHHFTEGRQALLVWYVPFNSEADERPTSSSTSSGSARHSSDTSAKATTATVETSSSLPKFQKLLRRHASKDREAMKRDKAMSNRVDDTPPSAASCFHSPLPFRSFRVVARVVDVEDLRSVPDVPTTTFDQWQEQNLASPTEFVRATSNSSTNPSPNRPQPSLPSIDDASSGSTAPTSTIMAGRTFPTVIAVCHSRSQGVEFVLEGLDRLGFCKGESAWGPTGYEEWRGSGLSDKGRELLDLLWAGCTGVMGLSV